MDNLRLILFFILAFVGLLLYQAWQQDYGPQSQSQTRSQTADAPSPGMTEDAAAVPTVEVKAELPAATATEGVASSLKTPQAAVVKVETDLLKLEISTQGGTVQKAQLLDYPVSLDHPDMKVELLTPREPDIYIAQSGLIGTEKGKAPSHEAIYEAQQASYKLAEGSDELVVPLSWTSDDGVEIIKQFVFRRGSYLADVSYLVDNQSADGWAARDYGQLQRMEPSSDSNGFTTYTYTGGVFYNPKDKYEKVDFDEMAKKKLNVESDQGWLAMIEHYFLSAWIPPKDQVEHYYTNALSGGKYLIGSYSPTVTVEAGEKKTLSRQLYIGPKLQDQLEVIAEGLELTVDYGWLTVIAKPIFWLLKTIHNWVGNWGWAIIILTLLIKAAFYKLSETSYKSMANMRKFTPRIQAIKDRYGDDKQRIQAAMMELYKKEKINPLGGCLPILVQIPVFIALYWVLLESVELRQAPWVLWIESLSEKDPYFILPLIMGVSMFVQQKLNPAPPDPMQAKIMMTLPFVFTIFFAFFPAGLVLYWVVNNLISIAQQWYITRKIEQAAS
ncbi:MAG: membrane protein insertase YidC [gamma proteobacterium symbiont of Ctena orbiculata]|uniref:Membrane protein insertase YidC n=1 Tax=Candidatus Thiodiazotropha taylori TaxID=2792791 RepID=A0A944MA46_9GAMM|nr:membrane protein insertase YidC [Candidatus Thiodiazotropha taylori]PUB90070.1 MAG: membrane protein insertase YidC [gamma proteobacterium symbiont of Ctena orbiculata]MBT2989617.1 membrane protein insertase YidC [Candidatus Thiodiazotropha taylori]MBT2997197.1 membrane protein insertase YidC [Candidatus Thiodiazotropha taylori]MBT3001350.1 membrane protein insertase YidC [Candidatus Thiodiazotropha taylori]